LPWKAFLNHQQKTLKITFVDTHRNLGAFPVILKPYRDRLEIYLSQQERHAKWESEQYFLR
jgi:hypothetical protein